MKLSAKGLDRDLVSQNSRSKASQKQGGGREEKPTPGKKAVRSIARANVTGPVRHPEGSLVTRRYSLQGVGCCQEQEVQELPHRCASTPKRSRAVVY